MQARAKVAVAPITTNLASPRREGRIRLTFSPDHGRRQTAYRIRLISWRLRNMCGEDLLHLTRRPFSRTPLLRGVEHVIEQRFHLRPELSAGSRVRFDDEERRIPARNVEPRKCSVRARIGEH